MQEWNNFYLEQSYRQASSTFETLILSPGFEKKQLRRCLETFSFENFNELMSGHWFLKGRCIWFLHGNLSLEGALELAEKGRQLLIQGRSEAQTSTEKENLAEIRAVNLSPGAWFRLEIPLQDKDNENSCLVSYFEAG